MFQPMNELFRRFIMGFSRKSRIQENIGIDKYQVRYFRARYSNRGSSFG